MTFPQLEWHEWSALGDLLAGVGTIVAVIGALVGGIVGLTRYRTRLKISAAELMLKMEEEFREVLPTVVLWEQRQYYDDRVAGVLRKCCEGERLVDEEVELMIQLDRSLRFFYLCTVLQNDLKIEQGIITRSHYYYFAILDDRENRPDLDRYLSRYLPRLNEWLIRHRPALAHYRTTGTWQAWRAIPRWRYRRQASEELASSPPPPTAPAPAESTAPVDH